LDLTILSFIFVTMLYNATNIRNIIDKKKTLEGLLSKKSQNQTVKLPGICSTILSFGKKLLQFNKFLLSLQNKH
ncbi:MAG: hypothetical protein J6M31_03415, partial [Bacteroidales bacterium]|nr:hypothetical protein [Bacteroidales bacterium]